MKYFFKISFILLYMCFIIVSCKKYDDTISDERLNELSPTQIKQRDNLNDIAQIVVSIADNNKTYQAIHSAVVDNMKVGMDEQFLFNEMLYPKDNKGPLSDDGGFGKRFKEAISSSKSGSNLESFILSENVQIYWPYSEEWDGISEPVITFDPIEDADENIGYKRRVNDDGLIDYDIVMVNDDYAFENPVWIINFCEMEETEIQKKQNISSKKGYSSKHQLSIGSVRSIVHYDNIFSGGDEYKFCIIGGKIKSMDSAEAYDMIQTIVIPRKYIRRGDWLEFNYELDDDWRVDSLDVELGRKFGLIEYDKNKRVCELKFEPKVVLKGVTVSVGNYSIETESNEGWIKVDTYEDRDQMMRFQNMDMGNGIQNGYRVYAAGGVFWTLPIREF